LAMIEMTSLLKYMSTNVDENEKIENEKIKTASDCHNDFYIFYLKNKIFLSQETCDLIDSLKDKYFDSYFDYTYGKKYENSDSELTYKLAKAASDKVRKEIPIVLKNIEQDFRTTIGIENEKK